MENGSCDNPFHGLVSCTRDIAQTDLKNRFPCSKFSASCAKERERDQSSVFSSPPVIGRAFWRAAGRAAQAWGPINLSVFASLSNQTVGLEGVSGTVSCIKFVKALGTDFNGITPPEERNYLKVILSCQSVGCIKRRTSQKIISI